MFKISTIINFEFKKLFRDKSSLIFMFLFPLAFILIMGIAFGDIESSQENSKISIGYYSNDTGDYSDYVINSLKENESYYIKRLPEDTLIEAVKNFDIEIGFIFPDNFSDDILSNNIPTVETLKFPSSNNYFAAQEILRQGVYELKILNGIIDATNKELESINYEDSSKLLNTLEKNIIDEFEKENIINITKTPYATTSNINDYNPKAQTTLGYLIMFVMFTILFSTGDILEEKRLMTWNRLKVSSTSQNTIMGGKLLSSFMQGWMQIIFLMLFGSFIMKVNFGESIINVIILLSVYLISVTGIGLFIANISKTKAQLNATASIFIITSSMISGLWWPIEITPEIMQKIALVFPQYWAMKGLRSLIVANLNLSDITDSIIFLMIIGLFFYLLSLMISFKNKTKNGR